MHLLSASVAAVSLAFALAAQAPSREDVAEALDAAEAAVAEQRWDDGMAALDRVPDLVAVDAGYRPRVVDLLAGLARGAGRASRHAVAVRARTVLLGLARAVHGQGDHEETVDSLVLLAGTLESAGRPADGLPHAEEALAMARRLRAGGDDELVAIAQNCLASGLEACGRALDAMPHYEAALAMRQRISGGEDSATLAVSINNLASCLQALGRHSEALPLLEQSLAMRRRLAGGSDDAAVARALNNLALCLRVLDRAGEALPLFEESLAMRRRLRGGDEHADVANARNNLGLCLQTMARLAEALPHYEAALATWRRLHGDVHPSVVTGANRVGSCLRELGRYDESVAHYELSLEVCQRLHGASDHPATATTLHGLALALEAVGRGEQAVQRAEQALAMWHRLFPRIDHPDKASTMRQYARLLLFERGDAAAALPHFEQALAMLTRTFRGQDNAAIALARHDLAYCLQRSGRDGEALRQFESALAMLRRLGAEHTEARLNCQDNIAHCLRRLGRVADSLASYEANMAERVRLEDVDPWTLAIGYSHLAYGLTGVGRHDEAWQQFELGWAIVQRIHASRDHADVVRWLCHAVHHLYRAGKIDEAEARATAGLAMARRLYGERDHPLVALALDRTAVCLLERLQLDAALAATEAAVAMVERLRGSAKATAEMRQSLFDELKESGTFERLQLIQTLRGDGAGAFSAAERSRGRGLLDLVEEQRFDVMAEAERRAALRGDAAAAARLAELRREVQAARLEGDRLLHQLTQIDDGGDGDAMAARRRDLRAASDENAALQRRLAGERARLLADVQPLGGVRSPAEVQAALQTGELLLHYTVSPQFSQVRVLARDGDIEVVPLIGAHGVVQRTLPAVLPRMSSDRPLPSRGRDPDGVGESHAAVTASRELFAALVPPALWERVRGCKRVFVAAHGELHRLPFELLVTAGSDGAPVHWLDAGPPTAYVPSGSVLHWLRQRTAEVRDDATSLDLLAVGDPGAVGLAPTPADGALVIAVSADGPGARAGLHVGDVVLDYDGQAITDDRTLRDARVRTEAAIEDGTRAADSIPLEVWRRGERVTLRVRPGLLGVEVARGKAGSAVATADGVVRSGEIERLRQLPPLHGARAETEAIGAVFAKHGRASEQLLGGEVTEPAVFDLAAKAKYLHFACHGVAEDYAGQSLSMLVLSPPSLVLPGDDGLLQLTDLLQSWRGRLASCRLVVLSACRSNVGPTFRDDAPQALPVGFLFAGAPAVISSLWAVDDASTRELMVDFYSRLLGGETDQLAAFTAAKRTLRAKFPDPFHWAPFLYLGSPE